MANKLFSSEENKTFLNAKCSIGCTAIQYACYYGTYLVFKTLLNESADVKLVNNQGLSCLHSAAQGDNVNIFFHLLVENNFDLYTSDNKESTVLHICAINGSSHVLDFLLVLEFPLELKDKDGNTALHLALYNSCKITRRTGSSEENIVCRSEQIYFEPGRLLCP